MPDEIDRDQEFNEQCLEAQIEKTRLKPAWVNPWVRPPKLKSNLG